MWTYSWRTTEVDLRIEWKGWNSSKEHQWNYTQNRNWQQTNWCVGWWRIENVFLQEVASNFEWQD